MKDDGAEPKISIPEGGASLTNTEKTEFVTIAEAALLGHAFASRKPSLVVENNVITVTYPPPKNAFGGDFIVKIDRTTKKVIDLKIWR